jgi:hypothetical protein
MDRPLMDKRERELRRTVATEAEPYGFSIKHVERAGSGHVRVTIGNGNITHLIIAAWSPRSNRQNDTIRKIIRKQIGESKR